MSFLDNIAGDNNTQQLVQALNAIFNKEDIDGKTVLTKKAVEDMCLIKAVLTKIEKKDTDTCLKETVDIFKVLAPSRDGQSRKEYVESVKMLQDSFREISILQERERERGKWLSMQ